MGIKLLLNGVKNNNNVEKKKKMLIIAVSKVLNNLNLKQKKMRRIAVLLKKRRRIAVLLMSEIKRKLLLNYVNRVWHTNLQHQSLVFYCEQWHFYCLTDVGGIENVLFCVDES